MRACGALEMHTYTMHIQIAGPRSGFVLDFAWFRHWAATRSAGIDISLFRLSHQMIKISVDERVKRTLARHRNRSVWVKEAFVL